MAGAAAAEAAEQQPNPSCSERTSSQAEAARTAAEASRTPAAARSVPAERSQGRRELVVHGHAAARPGVRCHLPGGRCLPASNAWTIGLHGLRGEARRGEACLHRQQLKKSTWARPTPSATQTMCLVSTLENFSRKHKYMYRVLNKIYLRNFFTDRCNFSRRL